MDIFLLLTALAIAVIFFLIFTLTNSARSNAYPYDRAGPLLTPAEHNFYSVLERVVPSGYLVTFKVRIGDVLKVRKGLDKKRAFAMRSKVQQKHFDFVICRADDMNVACCIELNDASHNKRDRVKRDAFVRAACSAAGVTLLEVKNGRSYIAEDIRVMLVEAIEGKPTAIADPDKMLNKEQPKPAKLAKLSSSKLAKKHRCSTDDFMEKLVESMYLERVDGNYRLTEYGIKMGGEEKNHPRFGVFFAWPEDLPFA